MMSFEEFVEEIERIAELNGEKVIIHDVRKPGYQYKGIMLQAKPGVGIPTADLNRFYHEYTKDPDAECVAIETAYKNIMSVLKNGMLMVGNITDYAENKDKLIMKLIYAPGNREYLQDKVHNLLGDIAIVPCIMMNDNEDNCMSCAVTLNMLEMFGQDKETVLEDAIQSSMKNMPYVFLDMMALMEELSGQDVNAENFDIDNCTMFVLTNKKRLYGAACMLYPGVFEEISYRTGCNLFVLPSSVHEVIIVRDDGQLRLEELESMVKDINVMCVKSEDKLADHVLYYSREEGKLMLARNHEKISLNKAAV